MPILGITASSMIKAIVDFFNRTTSGSLGSTPAGNVWSGIRGVWYANGSKAQSDDTATTYPVAVIPFSANATVTALTSNGVGVVFWQTASGDWWATTPYSYTALEPYCISNSCCTGSNTCASNSCCTGSPGGCIASSCCTGSNTCASNSCCTGSPAASGSTCVPRNTFGENYTYIDPCGGSTIIVYAASGCQNVSWSCANTCVANACCTGSNTCVSNSCCTTSANTCVANSCCTGSNTCASNSCCSTANNTRYYWAIKIIKAVAGVFTQQKTQDLINALNVSTEQVAGIKLITSGSNITVRGYSDTGLTAQVGTDVTLTDGTAVRGSGVGIIKTDSANNQGSTLDNFTAN